MKISRRGILAGTVAATAFGGTEKLALLGGEPVRKQPFPEWPVYDETEDRALRKVLHSGNWFRGSGQAVDRFEKAYADLTGSKHCLATANGTSALITSLNALEVGPGDEVILPPYTFRATLNVVLLQHALPIFVDTDISTFQIDAAKIEDAITERTAAIIPVHLGGSAANLDVVLRVAKKRGLPVIEDACQAHLAEWKGRKVGSLGTLGCFSFQASKNLNSGEGGAVLTDDDELASRCFTFHNNSRSRRGMAPVELAQGANLRMPEFQGALLVAQMTRVEAQSRRREDNARYLSRLFDQIEGIHPARTHEGCTRNAYHLYMFRYDAAAFSGLSRERFMAALQAEGVPCSGGYQPLNKQRFLSNVLGSKGYRRIYSDKVLKEWEERNRCPENDRLCEEAVWFSQTMLLGGHDDMEQIAEAVHKVQRGVPALRS